MKKLLTLILLFAGAVQAQVTPTLPSGATSYSSQIYRKIAGTDTTYYTGASGKGFLKLGGYADVLRLQDSIANKANKNLSNVSGIPQSKITGLVDSLTAKAGKNLLNVSKATVTAKVDTSLMRTVANSYTKAQIATLLGLKLDASEKGATNGVATLVGGKVPLSQINDALLGAVNYQGTYNASTNTPALGTASSANKGHYYIVSTAGTQGSITYAVGDWAISNGVAWAKVDNNNSVTSVFGRTGAVVATSGDYATWYQTLANLSTDLTASSTKYPSVNAVNTGLAAKAPVSGSANYIQNQNSTNQSADMRISGGVTALGGLGLGTAVTGNSRLSLGGSITGGTTAYGSNMTGTVANDVTTDAWGYRSNVGQASGFTLPSLSHFAINQGAFGGTVTQQNGFYVQGNMTGATSNYAFRSDVASGTGRWNLYMGGSAQNYLFGNLGIGSGKTNPSQALDVAGNGLFSGNVAAATITSSSWSGSGNVLLSADNTGLSGKVTIGSGLSLSGGVLTATGGSSGTVTTPGMTAGRLVVANSASDIGSTTALTISGSDLGVTGGVTASSFSGAGTGLTGTASALNIGGNAATVTTNANLTGVVTSTGNATSIADGALSIAKTSGLQTSLDSKQSRLFVNALDYVSNITGTVDVTSQLQAAINATPEGGTLWIPVGKYLTSGGLTSTKQITIRGDNGNMSYNWDAAKTDTLGTVIYSTSATNTLFSSTAAGNSFYDIAFVSKSTTPTASVGLNLDNAGFFRMVNCTVAGFYNLMVIDNGAGWRISNSLMLRPVNYGIKINHTASLDAGDWNIEGTWFAGAGTTATMIRWESSGGGKIINSKFNPAFGGKIVRAVEASFGASSDFIFSNNSVEGYSNTPIVLRVKPGLQFKNIQINNNQFVGDDVTAIDINGGGNQIGDIQINNNLVDVSYEFAGAPAIKVDSAYRVQILGNLLSNWVNKISVTNSVQLDTLTVPVSTLVNRWNGGSTGLDQSVALTSLGASTVGKNIFQGASPSAIRFLRSNADNTISWLDAATYRTAIGAANGTVTSITPGYGLTPTSAITTTGSFAVDTTSSTGIVSKAKYNTGMALKANLASPTFTGTVSGITKSMVGLGNVDNTSDASKPVSTAQASAIGVVQSDINTHEANSSNPHSVTKAQVGLGSVDNTSDASKPVSTATQTALNLKANLASPTFTGVVTSPSFVGPLTGTASTATTLATTRNIWGQPFNGNAPVLGAMTGVTTIDASGAISTPQVNFSGVASGRLLSGSTNWGVNDNTNSTNLLLLDNATGNLSVAGTITGTSISSSTTATTQTAGDNSTKIATTAFVIANSSGRQLEEWYTDVPTSGTAETDLYSYTIPANTLVNNGDKIVVTFNSIYTGTSPERKYYFGNAFTTNASVNSTQSITYTFIKSGTNSIRYIAVGDSGDSGDISVSLSSPIVLKMTGKVATGTMTGKGGTVEFKSAAP